MGRKKAFDEVRDAGRIQHYLDRTLGQVFPILSEPAERDIRAGKCGNYFPLTYGPLSGLRDETPLSYELVRDKNGSAAARQMPIASLEQMVKVDPLPEYSHHVILTETTIGGTRTPYARLGSVLISRSEPKPGEVALRTREEARLASAHLMQGRPLSELRFGEQADAAAPAPVAAP